MHKIPESENEAKQNWCKFSYANSIIKCVDDFFLKLFFSIYLGNFTHSSQSSTKCFSYIIF